MPRRGAGSNPRRVGVGAPGYRGAGAGTRADQSEETGTPREGGVGEEASLRERRAARAVYK